MPNSPASHRVTVISTSVDTTGMSAAQFESPSYRNQARLPVWCGAYLLGSLFTLFWVVVLSGVSLGARPIEVPEIRELELVMPPQPVAPPPVIPPVKPRQPPPKSAAPKPSEPPQQPQAVAAPTTNESSPLPPVVTEPPPEPVSVKEESAAASSLETSIPPPPIKVEPLFRLTRLPDISAVKNMKNYPAAEKNLGREGKVIAEFVIDERGAVRDIKILKSAGALFDQAVIDHLSKITFSPPYIGERPVAARFPVEFVFKLD